MKKCSDAIVNGNPGYNDHEMTELKTLRAERKTNSRVIVMNFREVNLLSCSGFCLAGAHGKLL